MSSNFNISRETFDEVMIPCYNPMPMLITKGKGSYVYDSENNEYIDFTSGIAVNCLGHCNKDIRKIIKKQSQSLMHISNIFTNDKTLTLAKKLCLLTGFDKAFFVNSGAEANEAALKLARRVAFDKYGKGKDEIISFDHSFHGRTFFSVCVGGQDKYSDGFGPKPASITHLPYNNIESFEKSISDKTCAVILEPCEGEGGIIPADPKFLEKVRALCTKHNALLIFDEVQTGVGRTGEFYAFMHYGIKPDILTTAKGLAAGLPIGAILTIDEYAKYFKVGTHGSTFGGNALSCAVGSYVVDTVSKKSFLYKVKKKSKFFFTELENMQKDYDFIATVRGMGLLIGVALTGALQGKASLVQKECAKQGLLVLVAGSSVVRVAPALNIKKKTIIDGLAILTKVFADIKEGKIKVTC